jgi:cytochrome c oxidase subunit 2
LAGPRQGAAALSASLLALAPSPASAFGWAEVPMTYLRTDGAHEHPVIALTWGLMLVSIAVIVIISGLVLLGSIAARSRVATLPGSEPIPVERPRRGLSFIAVGVGLSTVVLFVLMAWTATTMARIGRLPGQPALTVAIDAQQWWWSARYEDGDPSRVVQTANEIHIPVGQLVLFKLNSRDVIHSFWVPALGGKMDVIPGQTNVTWLQAERAGVYRGQCGEYCGQQHGHMGLVVIADPPDQFEAWRKAQLESAVQPSDEITAEGRDRFVQRCGACHTVRGTDAGGVLGPDLTHLMSRGSLAAATLPNRVAYLPGWIANPQTIKPGANMPNLDISGPELASIRRYLETLK